MFIVENKQAVMVKRVRKVINEVVAYAEKAKYRR